MYSEPITANAAHVYLSALSTAPAGTNLAKAYRDFQSGGIRVLAGPISEHWPGSLWVADRHSGPVSCCTFSPDGKTLASGSGGLFRSRKPDDTLRLWNVETGVQWRPPLQGHTDEITCMAFSPNGKTLASESRARFPGWVGDQTLRLWDVETGVQWEPALEGLTWSIRCLAFLPKSPPMMNGSPIQASFLSKRLHNYEKMDGFNMALCAGSGSLLRLVET